MTQSEKVLLRKLKLPSTKRLLEDYFGILGHKMYNSFIYLIRSSIVSDGWTQWDQWSPCRVTCGVGQSARKRTCRDDNRQDIPEREKTCKGIQREQRPCDSGSCSRFDLAEVHHWSSKQQDVVHDDWFCV